MSEDGPSPCPLPWRIDSDDTGREWIKIYAANGDEVLVIYGHHPDDFERAEMIVRAVENYDGAANWHRCERECSEDWTSLGYLNRQIARIHETDRYERKIWRWFFFWATISAILFILSIPFLVRIGR